MQRRYKKEAEALLEQIGRQPLEKRRMVRGFVLAMRYLIKIRRYTLLDLIRELGHAEGCLDAVVMEIEELGIVTLTGWNGEIWNDCYRSMESGYPIEDTPESYSLRPVYQEIEEGELKLIGFKRPIL